MDKHDYIVHRANSLSSEQDTFKQVEHYIRAGYTKLEVDIYFISEQEYKFCHPIGAEAVEQVFRLGDLSIKNFISRQKGILWLIDLKCLDVPTLPAALVRDVLSAFNPAHDIVTASQVEILELAHVAGFQTCRYRQNNQELSFPVDYYSMEDGQQSPLPLDKTFVYFPDPTTAQQKVEYAGVLIDGKYLE